MRRIEFVRSISGYNTGEIARFPEETAARYVQRGIAAFVDEAPAAKAIGAKPDVDAQDDEAPAAPTSGRAASKVVTK